MRSIALDKLVPGVVLAKEIYSKDGIILLEKGTTLSSKYILRLKKMKISEVFIEDMLSEGIADELTVSEKTRSEIKKLVSQAMIFSINGSDEGIVELQKKVESIIEDLLTREDIVLNLSQVRILDDYTFEHSVNVFILSTIIGISLNYNLDELKLLGIGAILHDIGKVKIPDSILKKPSQLTQIEFETIKEHSILGYEILSNCKTIKEDSAMVCLMHHERMDGSGYPKCIRGCSISELAKITAISDVFDALTSDRVYRHKLKPFEVVEYMKSKSNDHFDKRILDNFLRHVAIYPIGTGVIVNTGQKAIVTKINVGKPLQPKIRIISDLNGNKYHTYEEIDLSLDKNLYIMSTCDI